MTTNIEIITERLQLRPIIIDDKEAIYNYRSDYITNQYQGWIPKTIGETHDFIENKVSTTINIFNTWFQFVIIKKEDNELIGDLGIHFLDQENFQVEIGFTLSKKHQGKGYASEAVNETIKYLFNELKKRRITASIDPRNENSIKLVERLGFRKEAHFKESILFNGEWCDDVVYAILKDEWLEKNEST